MSKKSKRKRKAARASYFARLARKAVKDHRNGRSSWMFDEIQLEGENEEFLASFISSSATDDHRPASK